MALRQIVSAATACALLTASAAASYGTPIARAAPAVVPFSASDQTLSELAPKLERLGLHMPGIGCISNADLRRGYETAINGDVTLPAASTFKIPVMVEVFRQPAQGRFTRATPVALLD